MGQNKKQKSKTPIIYLNPSTAKTPRFHTDPAAFYNEKPAWRISHLEMAYSFGWHRVDIATMEKIRQRLIAFESMTWDEILNKAGDQHHQIKRDKICKDAKARLEELKLDDIDEVCSLRIEGVKRVFGILDRGILRLLWWDPLHQICPSHKKHT